MLLEAYMSLNATSSGVQYFLSSRHDRALAASEAGRTARTNLAHVLHLASLWPLLAFSNRTIWQSGSARACVVFDLWSDSSRSDGERSLREIWLTKHALSFAGASECVG